MRLLPIFIAAAVLSSCETAREPVGGPPTPLIDSTGRQIGTVAVWQTNGGVSFHVNASGLPHGLHGIHVHPIGRCDPPDFASAGTHWNPTGKQHGLNNPQGPHAGDLPNVEVAANGVLNATVTVAGATMANLLDADGAALVIHGQADDYVTDPSGNSGPRIACAVIRPAVELR